MYPPWGWAHRGVKKAHAVGWIFEHFCNFRGIFLSKTPPNPTENVGFFVSGGLFRQILRKFGKKCNTISVYCIIFWKCSIELWDFEIFWFFRGIFFSKSHRNPTKMVVGTDFSRGRGHRGSHHPTRGTRLHQTDIYHVFYVKFRVQKFLCHFSMRG